MKNNFTEKQYKTLIRCVALAGSVYGVMGDMVGEDYKKESKDIDDLMDYILNWADDFDMADQVDEFRGRKYVTDEYSDDIMDDLNEYEDYAFWDMLVRELARKEFFNKYSDGDIENMDQKVYLTKIFELEEKYHKMATDIGTAGLELKAK